MSKIYFTLICTILFWVTACSLPEGSDVNILSLKKNWYIQSSREVEKPGEIISTADFKPEGWYPTKIPSTILAALVENGVYENPYYGQNLKMIPGFREGRWLAMPNNSPFWPSWWYRTKFDIPFEFEGKNLSLHLDGINYKANIWLNGHQIADSNTVIGMFRRFELDITKWSKIGTGNVLAVEIMAPGKLPDMTYKTKQLEATTGWDDHNPQPPDLNMGIWRDVYIATTGSVKLKNPYIVTDLDLPTLDKADLIIYMDLINEMDRSVIGYLNGNIEDITFSKEIRLQAGELKTIKITPDEFKQLQISKPRLWWPYPVGSQNLYNLELEFIINGRVSDRKQIQFGIREVSTYINDEGWRGFKVNGKKILIRGGAWMTSDMLLRLSQRRYEALVRYAREANLNMLRSEGFSIRETDEFYNICDKYGVMVTQQIFGRSIPDEQLAIDNVKDMILRIRNHPSLVHFLGHDETFPTPHLDSTYRALIKQYTPERTYQPHSGAFEIEDRFKTGGTRTGTLELWSYANPAHYYTHKEDGAWGFAQSGGIGGIIVPLESMRKIMPEEDLWPPYNETFSFHTVLQGIKYFTVLINSMNARYGKVEGIEDFCLKGQVINYESARGMFEAYGRNKFDALGITTWKYDAAWPAAITWQYVDWYLNVGGAYYGAKKACEPLHVQYAYDDRSVYVINNFYNKFKDLTVTAKIYDFNLKERFSRTIKVDISENDKVKASPIEIPENLTKTYFLELALHDSSGKKNSDNFYWLSTVPDVEGKKGYRIIERAGQKWGIFTATPKSIANFTDLNKLPKVKLETDFAITDTVKEKAARVSIKNPFPILLLVIYLNR